MNYTEILLIQKPVTKKMLNAAVVIGTSWLIAISAQVTISLPFSPVPVTGQTMVVLLAGLILGKTLGTAAVLAYLIQGLIGFPFFAGGNAGFWVLAGPTGGYLVGFLAGVYIVGLLSELYHKKSIFQTMTALFIGNIIIYLCGLIWLVRFVGEPKVLSLGMFPFLAGDFFKILISIVIFNGSSALINRFRTTDNIS